MSKNYQFIKKYNLPLSIEPEIFDRKLQALENALVDLKEYGMASIFAVWSAFHEGKSKHA